MILLAVIIIALTMVLFFMPAKNNKIVLAPTTGIVITSPKPNAEVSFPINITGYINGNGWSGFEGQVGNVELRQGNVIMAKTFLPATTEWTSLPTYFEATILEATTDCRSGTDCTILGPKELVFHNENASGDPARDKMFILPIVLK